MRLILWHLNADHMVPNTFTKNICSILHSDARLKKAVHVNHQKSPMASLMCDRNNRINRSMYSQPQPESRVIVRLLIGISTMLFSVLVKIKQITLTFDVNYVI